MVYTEAEERVWNYMVKNQTATPQEVALNCDVAEDYARHFIMRIGTPIEVRQATAEQTTGYPDDNPKTIYGCLLYTSPSPRDGLLSRMPSSA